MSPILMGVIPIFAIIGLGWALRVSNVLPAESWPPIERLTYYVFYPGLLIPASWSADFSDASAGALSLGTMSGLMVVSAVIVLLRPLIRVDGPSFTSVFQGSVRWNSFVFLPIVFALFGQKGAGLAAIVMGALIPLNNVLNVLVLAKWGEGQGGGWRQSLIGILKNPVVWSCVVGLGLNALHVPQPPIVASGLKLLSDAALAMGLITAGSGLSFTYAVSRPWLIGSVSMVKLIVMPIVMMLFCRLFGGDNVAQGIAMACGAAPGAAAAYVLSRQMGGDARLMAGIVAFTTAASLVTIPLLMHVFKFG